MSYSRLDRPQALNVLMINWAWGRSATSYPLDWIGCSLNNSTIQVVSGCFSWGYLEFFYILKVIDHKKSLYLDTDKNGFRGVCEFRQVGVFK